MKEKAKNKIQETGDGYKRALDEVERLESYQEGRDLVAKLKEQVGKGREANDKLVELAMAGNGKEASEGFRGLLLPPQPTSRRPMTWSATMSGGSRSSMKKRSTAPLRPAWSFSL